MRRISRPVSMIEEEEVLLLGWLANLNYLSLKAVHSLFLIRNIIASRLVERLTYHVLSILLKNFIIVDKIRDCNTVSYLHGLNLVFFFDGHFLFLNIHYLILTSYLFIGTPNINLSGISIIAHIFSFIFFP